MITSKLEDSVFLNICAVPPSESRDQYSLGSSMAYRKGLWVLGYVCLKSWHFPWKSGISHLSVS